jgi:hypothetical protein
VIVGGSTEDVLNVLVELVILGEITEVGGEMVGGLASTEEVLVVLVELLMLGESIEKVLFVLSEPVVLMVPVVFGGRSGIETEAPVGAGIVPHSASEA